MNEILFLRFFTALATTNADDPDIHAANDYAISLVESNRAALARAEAAESLAYERLEAALFAEQRATDAEVERDAVRVANGVLSEALEATRSTLEALTARVAELEAQLAAQQWRPVTEPPEKAGDYAVMVDGWPDSIAAHYGPVLKGSSEGWEWVWVDFDGEIIPVVCWQSLPAAIHPAVG